MRSCVVHKSNNQINDLIIVDNNQSENNESFLKGQFTQNYNFCHYSDIFKIVVTKPFWLLIDFQCMEKKNIQDIQNTFYVSQKKIIQVWKKHDW